MPQNERLAAVLDEMSRMLEALGEDSFRASAHARAARAILALPTPIESIASDRAALLSIEGIGPKMADKIAEFCASGALREHAELRRKVPEGVLDLMGIAGLGPKTVHAMWKTLGVDSVAKLRTALDDGSLLTLPRMGEKAVAKIRAALELAQAGAGRVHLGRAWRLAEEMVAHLRAHGAVSMALPAGSLRRGRDTVGDLDIVVALRAGMEDQNERVMEHALRAPGVMGALAKGPTKASLMLSLLGHASRFEDSEERAATNTAGDNSGAAGAEAPRGPSIQCDVRVVPLASFGAALLYFTGSKEHNVRLRGIAQKRGLTLNEWGLYEEGAWRAYHDVPEAQRGPLPASLAGASEESVYHALDVRVVPEPELREDRGELELREAPALVSISDIRSELHAHTTASDGSLSIEELARAAHARGFHTIAVTDHSQSSTIAGGLKPDHLRRHIAAVREAHARLHDELGITILAGSEVDILADGRLDYSDDLLADLDIVVASPHAALTQDDAAATKRLLRAITHPLVHILGHPTGRLILRRQGLSPDMQAITHAAAEHKVALEVNAHWLRLDLRDAHVKQAIDAGCLIAIDCDVHGPEDFDNLRFGVATARRGWLTRERCVNAWDVRALREWLMEKRR